MPRGINIDGIQAGSLKTITDTKLVAFAVGNQKKSRFQKAREEQELKKKQEEQEAAKIYDDFVASFEDKSDKKTFVPAGGSTSGSSSSKKSSEMERIMEEMKERDAVREQRHQQQHHSSSRTSTTATSTNTTSSGTRKPRQIDAFLNEIKNRDPSQAPIMEDEESMKGSFDTGDPSTTNLYVGNISPSVTEEQLFSIFRKFGEINSIKVMWPRTEEEKARKRNCGFVSFMRRSDADDARVSSSWSSNAIQLHTIDDDSVIS